MIGDELARGLDLALAAVAGEADATSWRWRDGRGGEWHLTVEREDIGVHADTGEPLLGAADGVLELGYADGSGATWRLAGTRAGVLDADEEPLDWRLVSQRATLLGDQTLWPLEVA